MSNVFYNEIDKQQRLTKLFCIVLVLFSFTALAQKQQFAATGVPMGNLMPGPNAVYGFVVTNEKENTFNAYLGKVKRYEVYKDENGTGNFKKITSLTFPSSFAEFTKRAGADVAEQTKIQLGTKTDEEAYKVLVSGDPRKIGLLFLSKEFLYGMGNLWKDIDVKKNQPNTAYRLVQVAVDGKEQALFTQKVGEVSRIPFNRYELLDVTATDSAMQVLWGNKYTNTPAFMGKVYRKAPTDKSFVLMPKPVLITDIADSSKVAYQENVVPGQLYQYYLVPEDFAGNEGFPSDTAYTISKSFSKLKGIADFKAKDTLKGAWLSWSALPNDGVYTGIQILRSRKNAEGFVEIASISPNDSTYFDRALLPNVVYYYQIRPLLINVKGYKLMPSATTNIAVKSPNDIPMAPQGLKVWQDSTAQVKLYWDINPEIDQFAYYVLRGTSADKMEVVSKALRTNVYTDSLAGLDAQTTYFYGIKLMNISQKMSEMSQVAAIKPLKVELVPYPSGISARYAEGRVKLVWDDMLGKHDDIVGYRLYRKSKTDKDFISITPNLINTEFYEDTTALPGVTYEYGVTAVNSAANQSVLSPTSNITVPTSEVLAAPADLYLLNKAQGIYISWPAHADVKMVNVIYRKSPTDKDYRLVAEVNDVDNYTDTSAQVGVLYSYRIVAKTNAGSSNPSVEKSIRRTAL